MEEIPSFKEFTAMEPLQVKEWARKFEVKTAYYAVDGTRRHIHGLLGSEFSLESYYNTVQTEFLTALQHFINAGFENIIVLIWDSKVFDRGDDFVKISFEKGIRGTYENKSNLEFYKNHDISVHYSGFNDIYEKWGGKAMVEDMRKFEQSTSGRKGSRLFFHSMTDHIGDVMKLIETCSGCKDRDSLVQHVYGTVIPDVDAAYYFGKPREKESPILVMNNSVRFYSKAPSLAITWEYMVRSVYYIILHKISINDEYHDYRSYEPYGLDIEFVELMWGEKSYINDLLKPRKLS